MGTTEQKQYISKLREGIDKINKEIVYQVQKNQSEFVEQVNKLGQLEELLNIVKSKVGQLSNNVSRIKEEICEPFKEISTKVIQVERISESMELLRKTSIFLKSTKKLKRNIENSSDLPKAALYLKKLVEMKKESSLNGIKVVEMEYKYIELEFNNLTKIASKMLANGIKTQNQSEVANSLQVFNNLGTFRNKINLFINQKCDSIQSSILGTFNPIQPINQEENVMRDLLWKQINKLIEEIFDHCLQMWHLQRVLMKMRDSSSHLSLFELLMQSDQDQDSNQKQKLVPSSPEKISKNAPSQRDSLTKKVWKSLCKNLLTFFEKIDSESFVYKSLVSFYPKLIRLFSLFLDQLSEHHEIKYSLSDSLTLSDKQTFLQSFDFFKSNFLSK